MGRKLGKTRDAFRLLTMGLGQLGHLGFQGAQQLQEFSPTIFLNCLGILNLRFDIADGILDHRSLPVSWSKITGLPATASWMRGGRTKGLQKSLPQGNKENEGRTRLSRPLAVGRQFLSRAFQQWIHRSF